jgi:hypothetical protein
MGRRMEMALLLEGMSKHRYWESAEGRTRKME